VGIHPSLSSQLRDGNPNVNEWAAKFICVWYSPPFGDACAFRAAGEYAVPDSGTPLVASGVAER